ncbi:MAG: WecB/TagA/CpsF family glycosyltransferase [Clostridia bacterium]|nr:WecB/TagA/CpsF family glycosyltransferase [Clostridia bacterium]
MTVDVVGVPIQNVTMEEAVSDCSAFLDSKDRRIVVTPNAEILQLCVEDAAVKDIICQADYIVPDGIGVVHGAKILGTPVKQKVAGCDLAWNLLGEAEKKGKRVFLLGAKPGVADTAAQKMKEQYPDLIIAGVQDGYFKQDAPVIETINAAQTDLLFVCLGVPKQEQWMVAHRQELNVSLMMGLGGSLDVFAGTVKRAPKIFIKLGLEWLYRLIKEPWRFKRMMKLPVFFVSVFKYKKQRRKAK